MPLRVVAAYAHPKRRLRLARASSSHRRTNVVTYSTYNTCELVNGDLETDRKRTQARVSSRAHYSRDPCLGSPVITEHIVTTKSHSPPTPTHTTPRLDPPSIPEHIVPTKSLSSTRSTTKNPTTTTAAAAADHQRNTK